MNEEMIINGNRVYFNGYYWVVEKTDGFSFYIDRDGAIKAAGKEDCSHE